MDAMKEEMENVGLKVEKAGAIGRYSAVAIPVGSSQKKMTRKNKILGRVYFFFFFVFLTGISLSSILPSHFICKFKIKSCNFNRNECAAKKSVYRLTGV